jgi:hypothetical protein
MKVYYKLKFLKFVDGDLLPHYFLPVGRGNVKRKILMSKSGVVMNNIAIF